MNENWNRLEAVIKWAGMSANSFALHIGLKRSENLYQIKKGNHGISKLLADIIHEKYPQISRAWLLTGEGTMLDETPPPVDIERLKADLLLKFTDYVTTDGRKSYSDSDVVLLFHGFIGSDTAENLSKSM